MASEDELTSDSLDVSVRDVPDFLLEDLKSRVVQYITQAKDFSAQIQKSPGQSPKLVFSLGTKPAQPAQATSKVEHDANNSNTTCTLLVKNIPSSADEDLLAVFFESKKRQGGGPIECIKLFKEKNFALVEFEEPEAVKTVMEKRPIKYGQTTLDIQPYSPLLDGNETIGSLDVKGLPKKLTADILELHLDGIVKPGRKVKSIVKIPTYGPELAAMLKVGSRVVRGKDWHLTYKDQDRGKGTITDISQGGFVSVRWDSGMSFSGYRMGADRRYELMLTT